MICHCLYEEEIVGEISTKSSSKSKRWSSILKQRLQYAPSLNDRFLSVEIQAWLNTNRMQARNRNDVDNIAKLVLDEINQSDIINDDYMIRHLEVSKFETDAEESMIIRIREWLS